MSAPEATAPAAAGEPFYLTTAIAYPNGDPHIGHAYEYVGTDALARFAALEGRDVFYLTGTDEHGLKILRSAEAQGITPKQLVDGKAEVFRALHAALGSDYSRFIRTTDHDHYGAAAEMWRRLEAAGDIYSAAYSGWYSVRDEAYYPESETRLDESGRRFSIETDTEVEWTEESSYFFRLSAYRDALLERYRAHPEAIVPASRRNEVIAFLEGGLDDLSISRSTFDWGVPVPGDDRHVMYVWVDALTNYLTGVGFPDGDQQLFNRNWPADVHVIGKDILRFHAVYWPAFLLSAGLELPKQISVHGFLFNEGVKMSKSLGNTVDPFALIEQYGLDQLRYFLLREVPWGQDGSYSHEAIVARSNADLANEFGNLAQRSLSMVAKNLDGRVPEPGAFTADDEALLASAAALRDTVLGFVAERQVHRALEAIWRVLSEANKYFSAQEPWVLRTSDPARMATVLYVTLEVVRRAAILTQPVTPTASAALLDLLGQAPDARDVAALAAPLAPGTALPAPRPVFPRYVEPEPAP